jgi:hypothetical protein
MIAHDAIQVQFRHYHLIQTSTHQGYSFSGYRYSVGKMYLQYTCDGPYLCRVP